jgi:hypothetical protein
MNIISKESFESIIKDCDCLTEVCEAIIKQNTFVVCFAIETNNEKFFVLAAYDIKDSALDFSLYNELLQYVKNCSAIFYQTSKQESFNNFLLEHLNN